LYSTTAAASTATTGAGHYTRLRLVYAVGTGVSLVLTLTGLIHVGHRIIKKLTKYHDDLLRAQKHPDRVPAPNTKGNVHLPTRKHKKKPTHGTTASGTTRGGADTASISPPPPQVSLIMSFITRMQVSLTGFVLPTTSG
jgi:hypothetical protein